MIKNNSQKIIKDIELNDDLKISICEIFPKYFDNEDWKNYFGYSELIDSEYDDEAIQEPRNLKKENILRVKSDKIIKRYLVFNANNSEIIGNGFVSFNTPKSVAYEVSKDRAFVWISTKNEYRRNNIASHLLKSIVIEIKNLGINKIQTDTAFDNGRYFIDNLKMMKSQKLSDKKCII